MQLAPLEGVSLAGVMIGRSAYHAPWACLSDADRCVFGAEANTATSRQQARVFTPSCRLTSCFCALCAVVLGHDLSY